MSALFVIMSVGGVLYWWKSDRLVKSAIWRFFAEFTLKSPIISAYLYLQALMNIVLSIAACGWI